MFANDSPVTDAALMVQRFSSSAGAYAWAAFKFVDFFPVVFRPAEPVALMVLAVLLPFRLETKLSCACMYARGQVSIMCCHDSIRCRNVQVRRANATFDVVSVGSVQGAGTQQGGTIAHLIGCNR